MEVWDIYDSRNSMVLLEVKKDIIKENIYDSRNSMVLLEARAHQRPFRHLR